jgi:hypothetical protein
MAAPKKFFYSLKPDGIEELKSKDREELLDQIGEYLKFAILDFLGSSKSPVTGETLDKLSDKYSKKVGHKWTNLEFEGTMLDALDFRLSKNNTTLDIGFFTKDQAAKAYGHTTGMEGHPWLEGVTPERKILPMGKESFDSEIEDGIDNIIMEFLSANQS